MEENKKCKVYLKKRKDNKLIFKMEGYCNEKNPNEIINKEIEIDFNKLEEI
ncbi:MAG: hypothetical protein QW727_03960 [Candidatus Pacearchaeota archaeon]